ncbi:MAG TPA: ABC transporter permease [Terriglobales bacterium]|jgi:predicted permease|nr:ABC transporter permease [Terriglobales bacterium]
METLLQDTRYGFRILAKSPGFALVAVLTLALGIGANTAVFSVMNAVLLNPSGIPHPDRVLALRAKYGFGDLQNINFSPTDFGDALLGKDVFTSAAVLQNAAFNYGGDGVTPERLTGAKVSWQWFDVFWARPQLGHVFRPEEDQPGAEHEVVLSYRTWRRRFGGDPSILGRSLLLNQESYQVVGVMGPEFDWPNQAELWVPIALPPGRYFDSKYRHNEFLFAAARLRPGVTLAQANLYLQQRAAAAAAAEGQNSFSAASGWGMFAMPLVDFVAGNMSRPLLVLLVAVGIVLLIACANIAGLQLARASGRQREVSIQIALGAGSGRLVQQALVESLLLAVAGVAFGLLLAKVAIPLLLLLAPQGLMQNLLVHVGGVVLLFVAILGGLCALFCGAAPAWHATHVAFYEALKEGGRSETSSHIRQRLRSTLVVAEIALAMVLLVGAGLLLRSMAQIERVETGFEPRGLMSAALSLPPTTYKTDEQQAAFLTSAEEQLKNIPGVTSAALIDALPFTSNSAMASFQIEGKTVPPNDPGPHGNIRRISSDYFKTLRIPVLRGRVFTPEDRLKTQPVAVIDETLARRYWPNEDPIGQHISFGDGSPKMTIVGLVAHAKSSSLEADTTEGFYYLPLAQSPAQAVGVVVRTDRLHPEGLAGPMQSAIRSVDANLPLYDFKTMEQRVDDSLLGRRFLLVLLTIFAGLALLLAALGLYGVITYTVRLRTRELGIRMALGAQPGDVLRLVLGKGARLAAIGLALGVFATFAVGRTLSSLLFQVSLFNPVTLLLTALILSSTVLFASYLPARRAAKVDPVEALRYE